MPPVDGCSTDCCKTSRNADGDWEADIERITMVGEKRWQHCMTIFCKPFIKAEIRYFDHVAAADARIWLGGG